MIVKNFKDVVWKDQDQKRAGIVLYITSVYKNRKEVHFCLGYDKKYSEICDFGGRKNMKETIINCALREFSEETHRVFNIKKIYRKLENSICVFDNDMIIFFVNVLLNVGYGEKMFNSRITKNSEMLKLYWLNKKNLFRYKIYDKTLNFIGEFCKFKQN